MVPANATLKLFRGTYSAYWRENGGPRRRSLQTDDIALAKQRLEDVKKASVNSGGTIKDAWNLYSAGRFPELADPQRLKDAWKKLEPFWGALRPDQISRELCKAYTAKRKKDRVRTATIRKEIATLRSAVNYTKPVGKQQIWMPPKPKDLWLRRDGARAFLEVCECTPHLHLFVLLALSTAARKGALFDLQWDQVNFERNQINLETRHSEVGDDEDGLGWGKDDGIARKGRAIVPMHESLRAEMLKHVKARTTNYVIEFGGKPIKSIKRAFNRAKADMARKTGEPEWEKLTPHVLRHTAAVWMAEAGISMEIIAQFLGHTDPRITAQTYARFAPDHLKKAAQTLDLGCHLQAIEETQILGDGREAVPPGSNEHKSAF
jgi:integrase